MRASLFGFALFAICVPVFAQSTPSTEAEFTGHYYLSGVMETGSELLLNSDGSYQWSLIVGSLDAFSDGKWRIETGPDKKRQVILTANAADENQPPFSLSPWEPWNEVAEEAAQEAAMEERNNSIVSRCKFLDDEGELFEVWALSPPYQDVTDILIERAKEASKILETARSNYEIAAKNAMMGDAMNAELHKSARAARMAWRLAYNKEAQARSDAKLRFESRIEPILPKQCEGEVTPIRPSVIDKSKWIGGIAVRVESAQYRAFFREVEIDFGLESGKTISQVTKDSGIAWIPRRDDDNVISITIGNQNQAESKPYTVPVQATAQGFITANVNIPTEPPFNEMRLDVSGQSLIGFEGKGRYSRH